MEWYIDKFTLLLRKENLLLGKVKGVIQHKEGLPTHIHCYGLIFVMFQSRTLIAWRHCPSSCKCCAWQSVVCARAGSAWNPPVCGGKIYHALGMHFSWSVTQTRPREHGKMGRKSAQKILAALTPDTWVFLILGSFTSDFIISSMYKIKLSVLIFGKITFMVFENWNAK